MVINERNFHSNKLNAELKELRESEMWQAGKTVRNLRPENQSSAPLKVEQKQSQTEKVV
jgi:ketol-acid reductoisomerase